MGIAVKFEINTMSVALKMGKNITNACTYNTVTIWNLIAKKQYMELIACSQGVWYQISVIICMEARIFSHIDSLLAIEAN